MAHYQIKDVTFAYPGTTKATIKDISMTIEAGAFVLLCGASGSGKTTLLHQLKREIRPEGSRSGVVYYSDVPLEELDNKQSIEEIGIVFQNPDNQIAMNTVWQELAFGMENLGYSAEQIQRRLGELVQFFDMEAWLHLPVHELSGGQKQLLNVASVMALRPKVLLLDEPTAQLDPVAARQFIQLLARLNEELSLTIVMSEHRVEELFPLATQVVMLSDGTLLYNGDAQTVMRQIWDGRDQVGMRYIPSISQLYLSAAAEEQPAAQASPMIPLTVNEGRKWLNGRKRIELTGTSYSAVAHKEPKPLLVCKEIHYQYDKHTRPILKRLTLTIHKGEFYTLLGGNGSGKSTLLHTIAGALKPQRGTIRYDGTELRKLSAAVRSSKIGYVAQNPMLYFTRDTVQEQLTDRLQRLGLEPSQGSERLEKLTALFELADVLHKHPYDISGGQQQKVALMLVLLANPELLLLDEPTKGLDPSVKARLADYLAVLRESGTTIMMVSHDIEFTASHATRCGLLFDGAVVAEQEVRPFMLDNYFYTTMIHRVARETLPTAITVKDVRNQWGLSSEAYI